jgi:hypothetical protein
MNDIFKAAAGYAANQAWPMVQNWGMREDGGCMCFRRKACATPGKHPIHDDWLLHVTTDEDTISSWFEEGQMFNIGLPLGPSSGVIDTEWDDEKSFATAKRFGLLGIPTPGFVSSRGGHRLWKMDKRLIDISKGVKKIDGLEVRFGGGGKMTQSIIPPSVHHTGKKYTWEPGRSPDEVELATMPEALVLAVIAACGGEGGVGEITKNTIYERIIQEGERNDSLVAWISSEIMRMRDPHDPAEQQNVLMICRALNQTRLAVPMKDHEVVSIWQGQLRWGMKARASGATKIASTDKDADEKVEEARRKSPHTASGLEIRGGEWFPGLWSLTVVHSDPKEFRLGVPLSGATQDDEDDRMRVFVSLTSADWSSPIAVARKVLEATGTIDVTDPNPKEWAKIWNGYSYKPEGEKKSVKVRGLKVKLMDERDEEWPPAEQQRYCMVAGWLLEALTAIVQPEPDSDDSTPHPSGRPSWVRMPDGEFQLFFTWGRVFEDIQKNKKVRLHEGDQTSLKRRMLQATGESEFRIERVRVETGVRRRYVVWTQDHITHLNNIAHPDGQPDQKPLIIKGQIEFQNPIIGSGKLVCGPA